MAFAATTTERTVMGNKWCIYGTFTNDATSGTISVPLRKVEFATVSGATSVTASGGTVTVAIANTTTAGFWMAMGAD